MYNKNYYEILEIPADSTQEEINKSYMRAKNAYSGDNLAFYSLMSKEESTQVVELIEEAYLVLGNSEKRKQYNKARGFDQHSSKSKIVNVSGFVSNNQPIQNANQTTTSVKSNHDSKINASTKGDVKKLIAQKKFILEYKINDNFEKEIESTQNFSGELLQKIRKYKNVDLAKMSNLTKVSKTYLTHIENETYDRLPADVYVRGFVYQYAKCLKLNSDLVASTYLSRLRSKKE